MTPGELREARQLADEIFELTKKIPAELLHGRSNPDLARYKVAVTKAREIANARSSTLDKLRDARYSLKIFYGR